MSIVYVESSLNWIFGIIDEPGALFVPPTSIFTVVCDESFESETVIINEYCPPSS